MTIDFLSIFSLIRKIKYLLYLIIQYFIDLITPLTFKKPKHVNRYKVDKMKNRLLHLQPMLDIFEVNYDKARLFEEAKQILNHNFFLINNRYSFQPKNLKNTENYQNINWHYDPSTENQFPQKYWYRLIMKKICKGGDLKYAWELSRFQHLFILGQAYKISGDEKYPLEFINQIMDWINNNPVRYGINWSNTMEVGIRIANWTISLLFFIKSPHITKDFLTKYFQSVQQHGYHIYHNLENLQQFTSNHFVGNLFGLFILSSVNPLFNHSYKWSKFSKQELEKEIIRQTYDDGWDYEASTAYHRLVTEMFLFTFIIADYLNKPFSNFYKNRLKKMLEVLNTVQRQDHTIPQIGDNDSGFLLAFDLDNDNLNFRHLSILAQRNDFITKEVQISGFIKFEDAGYYIYKNEELYFLVTSGPKILKGLGSHAHNDVLSYIININGEDILVDPGTYVYMSDPVKRNYFRSISCHNTLYWNEIEPRDLNNGIFKLVEDGKIEVKSNSEDSASFTFDGKYSYKNRYHQRSIYCNHKKGYFTITDTASHEGANLNFTCCPDNLPYEIENGFTLNNVIFEFTNANKITINDSLYSPGYGQIQPTKSVNISLIGTEITYRISYRK